MNLADASTYVSLRIICVTMLGAANEKAVERIIADMYHLQLYFSTICWSMIDLHRLFRTKMYRNFLVARDDIFALVREMIADRRAAGGRDDLLQGLIDATDPRTGKPLSEKRILDEVIGTLIAGHETTGNTLAFAWDYLAKDPALQERLRDEAFRCMPMDGHPTPANLRNMVLTDSFIKEVERLLPSVWWVARTALKDDCIQDVRIKRGDVVMLTPYVTHRLEEFWPDAHTFKADRFVGQDLKHKFAFVPFGTGPRVCPGIHLASIEMKMAVARLLQRAEISGSSSVEVEGLITLRPRGGMHLQVSKLTRFVKVTDVQPGEHELVDMLLRTRRQVFVDTLDWPLKVDDEGREIDQFDNEHAEHCALVSGGELKAYGRLLPTEKQSLLYDVYGWLIDHPDLLERGNTVWEGTRMGTSPNVPAKQSAFWLRELIMHAARAKAAEGVRYFCSVSDPTLERVLRRTGIKLERLGEIKIDKAGIPLLALRLDCDMEQTGTEHIAAEAVEVQLVA